MIVCTMIVSIMLITILILGVLSILAAIRSSQFTQELERRR